MDKQKLLTPKELYTVKAKPFAGMGFLLFCFFPIFFFNPEVGIVDILPDFLGYVFLLIPMMKLRDISERFADAYRGIRLAALISLAKFVSIFLIFGYIGSQEGGYASSMMLFSLVFCILEFIFVIPAMRKFFSALHYSAERHECVYFTEDKGKKRRNRIDRFSTLTTIFLIVRNISATLPQFTTMSSHTEDDTAFNWSRFTGLFQILGVMLCLIFSIIWIIRAYMFFIKLCREKDFKQALKEEYTENVLGMKTTFILRNTGLLTAILTVASFFTVDIFMNENTINAIPDAIFSILVIIAMLLVTPLIKYSGKLKIIVFAIFGAFTASSIAKDVLHLQYFRNYTMFAYNRDPEAYSLFTTFTAVSIVDAIIFALCVFSICALIKYIENGYAISKLSIENESITRMNQAESREFAHSYILPVKIVGIIAAIATALTPFMLIASTTAIPATDDAYRKLMISLVDFAGMYWAFDFLVSFIFALVLTRTMSALKERVETKLMLD